MQNKTIPKLHIIFLLLGISLNVAAMVLLPSLSQMYHGNYERQLLLTLFSVYFGVFVISLCLKRFALQHVRGFVFLSLGFLVAISFDGFPYIMGQQISNVGFAHQDNFRLIIPTLGRILFALFVLLSAYSMNSIIDIRKVRKISLLYFLVTVVASSAMILFYIYLLPLFAHAEVIQFLQRRGFHYLSAAIFLGAAAKFLIAYLKTQYKILFWFAAAAVVLLFTELYNILSLNLYDIFSDLTRIGTLVGFSGFIIGLFEDDIRFADTEKRLRTALEKSLFETEKTVESYGNLFEKIDVGIGMIDQKSCFTSCNGKLSEMLGYEEKEIVGKSIASLVDSNHLDKFKYEKKKWIQGEETQIEIKLLKKSGRRISSLVSIIPSLNRRGDFTGGKIAIRDISVWEEAERKLKEYSKNLEKSIHEKTEDFNRKSEELEKAKSYYSSLISGVSEIILVVNNDGNCTFINDYGQKLLGYSAKKLNTNKIPDFFRDLGRVKADYGEAVKLELRDYEHEWKTKSGKRIPCVWNVRFLFDHGGNRIGTVGVGRDITASKKMEQQLRHYREDFEKMVNERTAELQIRIDHLRKVLETGKALVLNRDLNTTLTDVCKIVQSFGWKKASVLLKDADSKSLKIVAMAGPPRIRSSKISYSNGILFRQLEKHLRDEFKISHSYFLEYKENASAKEKKRILCVPIEIHGKNLGWITAAEPLNAHKPDVDSVQLIEIIADNAGVLIENARLFQQTEMRSQELKKVNQLKTEFLANMSHELRTPLNSILSLSDLLLKRLPGDLNSEQIKQVNIIKQNGENLLRLINDILDLMKIESGSMEVTYSYFSFESFLHSVVAPLEPLCKAKKLKLEVKIDKKVPQRIFSDKDKISQALTNILSNAIKFTEKGKISVKVKTEQRGSYLRFSVQDRGIGIPPQDLDNIFEEFKQLGGPDDTTAKGSGLGLSIANKLFELLGGKISVKSKLGKGSTFDLILPLKKVGEIQVGGTSIRTVLPKAKVSQKLDIRPKSDSSQKERELEHPASRSSKRKTPISSQAHKNGGLILVIDDDESNQYATQFSLEEKGFRVIFANNGKDGIEKAVKEKPDLILMDMIMPGLDGFEATRRLKKMKHTQSIPVIAMTAKAMKADRKKTLEAGCVDYIAKPFPLEDLVKKIKKWMNRN